MTRLKLRVLLAAWYFAFAPIESASWWDQVEARPAAILVVGDPVLPLVASR